MTAALLLEEALKLPVREREVLCDQLHESLVTQKSASGAWEDELQRRIQHAEEHPEEGVDWEDFKAEMLDSRGLKL